MAVNIQHEGSGVRYADVHLGNRGFARVSLTGGSDVRIELRSPDGGLWSATELPLASVGEVLAAATSLVGERLSSASHRHVDVPLSTRGIARVTLTNASEVRIELRSNDGGLWSATELPFKAVGEVLAAATALVGDRLSRSGSDQPEAEERTARPSSLPVGRAGARPAVRPNDRSEKKAKAARRVVEPERPKRDFFKPTVPGPAPEDAIKLESITDTRPQKAEQKVILVTVASPPQTPASSRERVSFVDPKAAAAPASAAAPAPAPTVAASSPAARPTAPYIRTPPASPPPEQVPSAPPTVAKATTDEAAEEAEAARRLAAAEAAAKRAVVPGEIWAKCTFCDNEVLRDKVPAEDRRVEHRPDGALWTVTCYHCGTVLTLRESDWRRG